MRSALRLGRSWAGVVLPAILGLICNAVGTGEDAAGRAAVPSPAQQAASGKLIREVYKQDLAQARDGVEKSRVAAKLLREGEQTRDDPAGRYALFTLAIDLSIEAADVDLALEAAGVIGKHFAMDAPAARLDVLVRLARAVRTPAGQAAILRGFDSLIDDAVQGDRYDLARHSAEDAIQLARRMAQPELVARAAQRAREVREVESAHDAAQRAATKIAKDPADRSAHLVLGRFLCFAKGQWEKGLPHLVSGSDPLLKAMAEKEILKPADASEKLNLADGWWMVAANSAAIERREPQRRAAGWYREALPELSGLHKAKAEARIREAGDPGEAGAGVQVAASRPADTRPQTRAVERHGAKNLLASLGIGQIRPNVVMMKEGLLIGDEKEPAWAYFQHRAGGEYDLRVSFTLREQAKGLSEITIYLPMNDGQVMLIVQTQAGGAGAVGFYPREELRKGGARCGDAPNGKALSAGLARGQPYEVVVRVRKAGTAVVMNDTLVFELKDFAQAHLAPGRNFGVRTYRCQALFHRVEVVEAGR